MHSTLVKTRFFTTLVLLAVFVASCAPAAATETTAPVAPTVIQPTATFPPLDTSAQPTAGVTEIPTEAIAPTAIPVATSRGPNLEATDPSTVNLSSGQLQFVEFFRFT